MEKTLEFKRNSDLRKHIFALAAVVIYEQGAIYTFNGKFKPMLAACNYFIDIPYFYLASLFLIPLAVKVSKTNLTPLFIILFFASVYIILYEANAFFSYRFMNVELTVDLNILIYKKAALRLCYLSGIALAYYHAKIGIQKAAMGEREKSLRIGMENANFRSQINTHLLFNTLWFVYTQIVDISTRASEALLLLSKVMRYSLKTASSSGKILLSDELANMKDYINLMRVRAENAFCLELNIDEFEPDNSLKIPPGIFSNFIVNVFKHGVLINDQEPATIKLTIVGSLLHLHTHNLKAQVTDTEKNGLGMKHIKAILDQWYSGNYRIDVDETDTHFDLDFRLQL